MSSVASYDKKRGRGALMVAFSNMYLVCMGKQAYGGSMRLKHVYSTRSSWSCELTGRREVVL